MTTNYGTTIDDAVRVARVAAPYYARSLDRLRLVPDGRVPTMATSAQWVTHYNPATVATWTPSEAAAVLVHELEHLLRRHAERCGERDHGRFNAAADAEINQRLPGLPDGAIYPESFGMPRGRTAEVYYGATSPRPEPEPDGDGGGDGGDPGDGDPGDGAGAGQPGDGDPQPGSGAGQPGGPDCGSAAGGETREWERGDAPTGPTEREADELRKDAARRILSGATGRGTEDAAELRDWAEGELGIDRSRWYSALAGAVGHTLSSVGAPTRWRWPGRRDPRDIGGAVLPRWTGERPSCAVIIDTSSSITPGDLDMARAAGHFLGRLADVTYYGCNTRPTCYGPTLPERLYGGGGTNLVTGIEQAIADGARAVVVITDCETPWPTEPTRVPVIIGANPAAQRVLEYPGGPWFPPDWTVVIPIIEPTE